MQSNAATMNPCSDNSAMDEYVFKICLVGESNTGKTTLANRICKPKLSPPPSSSNDQDEANHLSSSIGLADEITCTTPTIGVEFSSRVVSSLKDHPNILVRLQLWDTAGVERYAAVSGPVYRNAAGIIAVLDMTNPPSLSALITKWLPSVFSFLPNLLQSNVLIVCNKMDLVDDRCGDDFLRDFQVIEALVTAGYGEILVIEASAKYGDNVENAVRLICEALLNNVVLSPMSRKKKRTKKENVVTDSAELPTRQESYSVDSDVAEQSSKVTTDNGKKTSILLEGPQIPDPNTTRLSKKKSKCKC
eukprot:Tbor_TRINITY_DN3331_c0_g1::TRINITY_DN3331_c0_g1_i1::g.23435::m.23435